MQLEGHHGREAALGKPVQVAGARVPIDKTERLLDRSLAFMQLPGTASEFVNFYANDRELKRLEIDVDARVSASIRASLVSCCANTPCAASCCCCLPNLALSG